MDFVIRKKPSGDAGLVRVVYALALVEGADCGHRLNCRLATQNVDLNSMTYIMSLGAYFMSGAETMIRHPILKKLAEAIDGAERLCYTRLTF